MRPPMPEPPRPIARWTSRRIASTVATAIVLLVAAGCGGGSGPATDYRAKLDAMCSASETFNLQLPKLQQQKKLSMPQLQKVARDHSDAFVARLEKTEPPDDLKKPVAALDSLLKGAIDEPPGTPAATRAYLRALIKDYAAVGADGCEGGARRSLNQFEATQES